MIKDLTEIEKLEKFFREAEEALYDAEYAKAVATQDLVICSRRVCVAKDRLSAASVALGGGAK